MPEWLFEPDMSTRNRVRMTQHVTLLIILDFLLLLFFYQRFPSPLSIAHALQIVVLSVFVLILWWLQIPLQSYEDRTVDLSGAFILVILLTCGPFISLFSYTIGTLFHQFFRKNVNLRPKIITILANTFTYGASFLLVMLFGSLKLSSPLILLLRLSLVLVVDNVLDVGIAARYLAILYNDIWWKKFKEGFSREHVFVVSRAILLFPGLAYIAWRMLGLYYVVVALIVPFLVIRTVMLFFQRANEEINATFVTMGTAVEARDHYTQNHCNNVGVVAKIIAIFMGLSDVEAERISMIGNLHDLGKILVNERILNKDGMLSPEEAKHVQRHTELDDPLLNKIPIDFSLRTYLHVGRLHHERYGGGGYPFGLKGEEIPLEARIVAVADGWDAMTSDRSYRKGMSPQDVMMSIKNNAGNLYDPAVVEAFLEACDQGALKANVLMKSEDVDRTKWKVPSKPIKSNSTETKMLPKFFQWLFSHKKNFFFALGGMICGAMLYLNWPQVLFSRNVLFYMVLAILLDFWEVKFPHFPKFVPAEMMYLALAFLLPFPWMLLPVPTALLARFIYYHKIKVSDIWRSIRQIVLISISFLFFVWIGLHGHSTFLIPKSWSKEMTDSAFVLSMLVVWGVLFSVSKLLLQHLEAVFRRRTWRVAIDWSPLKFEFLFDTAITGSFGLLLYVIFASGLVNFYLAFFGVAIILLISRPIINYFYRTLHGSEMTIEAIADAAEGVFPFYQGHSKKVAGLAGRTAITMGLSDEAVEGIMRAAKVQNIGTIGIPMDLLIQSTEYSDDEIFFMKEHVSFGVTILQETSLYRKEVPLIRSHHERFDGTGYPDGLSGDKIPLGGRIIALSDTFEALITPRPHRRTFSIEEAVHEIEAKGGTQFDPKIIDAFLKVLPGYLVWRIEFEKNNIIPQNSSTVTQSSSAFISD